MGGRTLRCLFGDELVALIELFNLTDRSPTKIAVTGVPQIGVSDRLEAATRVESTSNFVGDGLVLNEAMFPSGLDGFFVKDFSIREPALDPRNLGFDQRRPVSKILGTVLRQY